MKIQCAFAALLSIWHAAGRGLKTVKVPVDVEAENVALKERNKQLEAMMQVARNEVHKMDAMVRSSRSQQQDKSVTDASNADRAEADGLEGKLHKLEAEKQSLMQTLRKMLARNSTRIFQKQVQTAEKAEEALSSKFDKERSDLQAQIKDANDKAEEAKEEVQTLQQQNLDLRKSELDLQTKLKTVEEDDKGLAADKANLMETTHGLMRESMQLKKALEAAQEKQSSTALELAAAKDKLVNLTKSVQKPANAQPTRRPTSKSGPLHLKHEESTAFKIAKMNHINNYIDRSYSGDDSIDIGENAPEKVDAAPAAPRKESYWSGVTQQEGALEKKLRVQPKHAAGNLKKVLTDSHEESKDLGKWLGLKSAAATKGAIPVDADGMSPIDALDPEAVKQEKSAQKAAGVKQAKADADDGGDGIEGLLNQAKEQLDAMDRAEAQK